MMEQRNNLVLQGTETFSRGQLDNLALENGSLVLDRFIRAAMISGRSISRPKLGSWVFRQYSGR